LQEAQDVDADDGGFLVLPGAEWSWERAAALARQLTVVRVGLCLLADNRSALDRCRLIGTLTAAVQRATTEMVTLVEGAASDAERAA
jgi:hypothetical protein